MAETEKSGIPDFFVLDSLIRKGKRLPVYYLFGKEEDRFSVESALDHMTRTFSPEIKSDFDRESFTAGGKQNFSEILDICLAFPFGSGKKLILVKDFNDFDNKKLLLNYLSSPPEFTILILTQIGGELRLQTEPFKSLKSGGYCFQPPKTSGRQLVEWVIRRARARNKIIKPENAFRLIEISGEIKGDLDGQIQIISDYLGDDRNEIDLDIIKKVSSPLRKYEIFDLYDALKDDKQKSVHIILNLLDYGLEPLKIIGAIFKYIVTIARSYQLEREFARSGGKGKTPAEILKKEMHKYFYFQCSRARTFFSDERLSACGRALLKADFSIKNTSMDPKTVFSVLISEFFQDSLDSSF